ncbi:uncharacterized protein LOC134768880 [Penaeus indicus]|uniref:uncharacterized protein LOC134768880 n=1 Tax=Penaeus indicus TaxID=29960 RepID=UPI00300D9613
MTSRTSITNPHKKIKRIEGIWGHTPPNFCCSVIVIEEEDVHTDQATLSPEYELTKQEHYITILHTQQATISKLIKQLLIFVDGSLSLADLPTTILSAKELIADCFASVKSKAATAKLPLSFPHKLSKIQHFKIGGIRLPSIKRILLKELSCLRLPVDQRRNERLVSRFREEGERNRRDQSLPYAHAANGGQLERDCDFCKARGHTLNSCRWKASADKAELLERELKNFMLEYRSCQTQKTAAYLNFYFHLRPFRSVNSFHPHTGPLINSLFLLGYIPPSTATKGQYTKWRH